MTPTAPAPTAPAGPAPTRQVDGRHRRRATNRDAVVEALLGLYDRGSLDPSIAEVAEAAGLSPRSVFRYFDDAEDLVRAAIGHQQRRLAPLFSFDVAAGTPLPERIDRFVEHRTTLFEAMGNVGRVARLRAGFQPLVGAELTRVRDELRDQVAETFAAELADSGTEGSDMLRAADVAVSFEAYDLLLGHHGLDRAAAIRTMCHALSAIFGKGRP